MDLERITSLSLTRLMELTRQIRILMGDVAKPSGRSACIDLTRSVALVVYLLRNNVTQDAGEAVFGVSAGDGKPPMGQAPQGHRSRPARFHPRSRGTVLADGTLAPTWNWRAAKGMYSGKRKTTGFNIQVACDLDGRVVAIGRRPVPGARHDAHAFHTSGLADQIAGLHRCGDSGYQGHVDITPAKKPRGRKPTAEQKQNDREISGIRAAVE